MKTKEDILLGYPRYSLVNFAGNIDNEQMYIKDVRKALDEYAKQQAIAFDRFKRDNIYTIDADGENYHKLIIEGDGARTEQYPFEKVYAQFIESQNK